MVLLLVAACGPHPICDPDQVPIRDVQGFSTLEDRSRVRGALRKFADWSGREVCLDEVVITSNLEYHNRDLGGRWSPQHRTITLDHPSGLVEGTVFHELCHAIDTDEQLTEGLDHIFRPAHVEQSSSYPDDRARRRENFARRCELGPMGPVVSLIEGRCGDPAAAWVEDHVWSGATEPLEIRLAAPPVAKTTSSRTHLTSADWSVAGTRVLHRKHRHRDLDANQAEVLFLDDDFRPTGPSRWVPWETQLEHPDWRVLRGQDQAVWAPVDGAPWLLSPDDTARPMDLPVDSWRGAWAANAWWLWSPQRPESDALAELTREGDFVAWHPLPAKNLGPILELDGAPVLQDRARHHNRVRDLDGELLFTLPRPVTLYQQADTLVIGLYSYTLPTGRSYLREDEDHVGLAWLDDAGTLYVESPCGDSDPLERTHVARHMVLESDGEEDTLDVLDEVRSYGIE